MDARPQPTGTRKLHVSASPYLGIVRTESVEVLGLRILLLSTRMTTAGLPSSDLAFCVLIAPRLCAFVLR